jgi:hydrogenase maturation protein HypF
MRLKIAVHGAVQGVGFRPFVHRLATELHLDGWVCNSPQGVFIEVEGAGAEAEKFLARLKTENPPFSSIQSLEFSRLDAIGYHCFETRKSETSGDKTALVLPDIATCPDCLREIFDPANRRYLYPFTNCTHCGPRFSIIEALPYDRGGTSMKHFAMCPECRREYEDPANRRFHAQPNACPVCGPRLELWEKRPGNLPTPPSPLAHGHVALLVVAKAIRRGQIVAVKGIGGFHLMVDARNDDAVRRLRARKHRDEKPFALLFPSLEFARQNCKISALEEKLLRSPEAPIVLLEKNHDALAQIAGSIAPKNPNLGVMLPSNPLHHLLMAELGFPVVATSGNLTDEPICKDECEALACLRPIADLYLVHNRPIVRHVDDSIVRAVLGHEMILRRARGYAPFPIPVPASETDAAEIKKPMLAVGGQLKNSVALAVGDQAFISQHIGDLETEKASNAFRHVIADFQKLYEVKPQTVVSDFHPDYFSTKFASTQDARPFRVQHHVAHILSCMADNEIEGPALGVCLDGTGYGPDNTIWGGEFFLVNDSTVERVAHLRTFPLPGGDAAIREPRRAAMGLLYEMFGAGAFELNYLPPLHSLSSKELRALRNILQRRVHSPMTSSVGRLFDAVSALIGLRQFNRFEGQAAMALEFARDHWVIHERYPISITDTFPVMYMDWRPMIEAILSDISQNVSAARISAKFHNALVEGIIEVAGCIGLERVVLSGGCFQNRYLLEQTIRRLFEESFSPYWHRSVPPNDGGIALGQIVAARKKIKLVNVNESLPVPAQRVPAGSFA